MGFGNVEMADQERARYENEAMMQRTLGARQMTTSAGTIRGLADQAPKESATARELAQLQKMTQVLAAGVQELGARLSSVLRVTAPTPNSDDIGKAPSTGVPLADGIASVNGDLHRIGRQLQSLIERVDL